MGDLSLSEAALGAWETARHERLPLAYVAEQSGRPQHWFAGNILAVAAVEGRHDGESEHRRVPREIASGATLADDLAALHAGGKAVCSDLRVSAAALAQYLDWARTVY